MATTEFPDPACKLPPPNFGDRCQGSQPVQRHKNSSVLDDFGHLDILINQMKESQDEEGVVEKNVRKCRETLRS